MTFEDMQAALNEVKRSRRIAANHAVTIGELFEDTMRDAGGYTLARIKKKLRGFDMKRKCWIER